MKLIERRCGLTVLSLAVIAGGIALVLISLPSEGQTAKSLSEADIKKIDDVTQSAVNAALARDFATWASLFLDDAVVNPPNEPVVKGRAAIRAWLEKFPPITEFKLNNEKVEGREDLAYVLGTYTMTITPLSDWITRMSSIKPSPASLLVIDISPQQTRPNDVCSRGERP
jgi:ketosteroid isomerase-like protein